MTESKIYKISCDGDGDGRGFCDIDITGFESMAALRRNAKANGWGRKRGSDLCPECMADIE